MTPPEGELYKFKHSGMQSNFITVRYQEKSQTTEQYEMCVKVEEQTHFIHRQNYTWISL